MRDTNQNEKSIKPWLDAIGRLLSTEQLRKISAFWSAEQWEEYLQFLETPLQEALLPNYDHVTHCHDTVSSLERFINEEENAIEITPVISPSAIREGLRSLTHKQRKIIELCILEGKNLLEVSELLGTNPRSAGRGLERGLERLKLFLDPKLIGQLKAPKRQETTGVSV